MDANELELENKKLNHSRERFWVGSVALVLVTSIVNWQIQNRQIEIKRVEEQNKHLSQFVESILDKDPRVRVYVSEYFAALSLEDTSRERWQAYRMIAQSRADEADQAERDKVELQVRLFDIIDEINDPKTDADRRRALQADLIQARIDIKATERLLTSLNPKAQNTSSTSTDSVGSDRRLRGIVGGDDRTLVPKTTISPWNSVCQLVGRGETDFRATGFAVSRRVILTAGYIVSDRDGAYALEVVCGRNGEIMPFSSYESRGFITYMPESSEDDETFGAIILAESLPPVIDTLKIHALEFLGSADLKGLRVTIPGYPGDKEIGTQWRGDGDLISFDGMRIFYDADTVGGVGGAPVLSVHEDETVAIGVHWGGDPKFGVAFTDESLRWIQSIINNVESYVDGR